MKILKQKIVKFDNKPIPIKNPIVYPQSNNNDLPFPPYPLQIIICCCILSPVRADAIKDMIDL